LNILKRIFALYLLRVLRLSTVNKLTCDDDDDEARKNVYFRLPSFLRKKLHSQNCIRPSKYECSFV